MRIAFVSGRATYTCVCPFRENKKIDVFIHSQYPFCMLIIIHFTVEKFTVHFVVFELQRLLLSFAPVSLGFRIVEIMLLFRVQ